MKQQMQPGDTARYANGNSVYSVTIIGGHISTDLMTDEYESYTVGISQLGEPLWTMRVPAVLLSLIKRADAE